MRIRPSALIVKDNQVLTLKYSYPKGSVYVLPGGNLEFGEGLKPALERELMEEIGIQCELGKLLHVAEVMYEGENTVHFIFNCVDFSGDPLINPKETKAEEITWIPLAQLTEVCLYPAVGSALLDQESPIHLGVLKQPRL